jgi:hypothetical protein
VNNCCRNDIQRAGVQYIIDSVVAALLEDEERRFGGLVHLGLSAGSSMLSQHSSGDGGMNRLTLKKPLSRIWSMREGGDSVG